MSSKDCCLAVVQDLQRAGLVCLELCLEGTKDIAISICGKPDAHSDSADFIRIKNIGTIICRGNVAVKLKKMQLEHPAGLLCFEDVLNFIGVPAHHKDIYERALKSGLIIMILQGTGETLRRGCGVLEDNALEKPVLYLT